MKAGQLAYIRKSCRLVTLVDKTFYATGNVFVWNVWAFDPNLYKWRLAPYFEGELELAEISET